MSNTKESKRNETQNEEKIIIKTKKNKQTNKQNQFTPKNDSGNSPKKYHISFV